MFRTYSKATRRHLIQRLPNTEINKTTGGYSAAMRGRLGPLCRHGWMKRPFQYVLQEEIASRLYWLATVRWCCVILSDPNVEYLERM